MGIADYADKNGWQPAAAKNSVRWFQQNPQAAADVLEGRALGLSWEQIHTYLKDTYGYPQSDAKSVKKGVGL